jgi:hypothetical protein
MRMSKSKRDKQYNGRMKHYHKIQQMICKTLHRKLENEQHEPH